MSTSTLNEPAFVARLHAIKASLERARRFTIGVQPTIQAATQAEGDIEELLIDYGFQNSDEREADRKVHVHVDHQVQAGSGHNGNFRNRTYEQAKEIYDRESQVPSYLGTARQGAALMRITTITETLS